MEPNNEKHGEILYMLGEIRGDVKGINERLNKINGRIDKHDLTLAEFNNFKIRAGVFGGLLGFAVSLFGSWIIKKL